MALSAVIFDLDGTLLDTNELHAQAWEQALEEHGYLVPARRILKEIGKGGDKLVPTLLGEEVERLEGEALRDRHDEIYMEMIEGEEVRVFPKVEALFEALRERGLKIAIATASQKESLKKVLQQTDLDLLDWADEVVTDSDVERSKPQPDTVDAAVRKLGLSPGQCVMVGDTPYDVTSSRRAGVVCLGVLTGAHSAEAMHRAGARASYQDTADLLAYLDEALECAAPGSAPLTDAHMNVLMQEALDEAQAGMADGEVPIGSVLARGDGTILARGRNRARATKSAIAHAEMIALAEAAGRLHAEERGLVLATTVEPCVMCLGAAMLAGVDTVIYALDAPQNGGTERCLPLEDGYLPRLVGGVRASGSRALLAEWLEKHPDDAFVRRLLQANEEE